MPPNEGRCDNVRCGIPSNLCRLRVKSGGPSNNRVESALLS